MTDNKNNKDDRLEDPKGSDGKHVVENQGGASQAGGETLQGQAPEPFFSDNTNPDSSSGGNVDLSTASNDDTPPGLDSGLIAQPTQEGDSEEPKTSKKKGGKKEKTPKAAAAKTAKKPKVKKAKKDKPASNTDNPVGFYWLWFALTVAFLGFVDAVAYKQAGPDSFLFIGVFDGLGLLLLSVPLALIGGSRKFQYSLTDIFLALAAFFAVLSCLAILTCQAQYYGASAKVAALITSVTTTFYV